MAISPARTPLASSIVSMDTIVTAQIVGGRDEPGAQAILDRALGWFREVERVCSRFDPESELSQLCRTTGEPWWVSTLLFQAVSFGLKVAELTDGAFDPTVGARQANRGFDRDYVTGQRHAASQTGSATWRDVRLDTERGTIELGKPLLLDLGAVAKGLAVDLAALELGAFESFSIDAGGDVYVRGKNEDGQPWRIGIEHPREDGLIATVELTSGAVCSSGDYFRRATIDGEHHLLDPRSGISPRAAISCSVLAPSAMLADALSTAAFVLGPKQGLPMLDQQGVQGMIVGPDLRVHTTKGWPA